MTPTAKLALGLLFGLLVGVLTATWCYGAYLILRIRFKTDIWAGHPRDVPIHKRVVLAILIPFLLGAAVSSLQRRSWVDELEAGED